MHTVRLSYLTDTVYIAFVLCRGTNVQTMDYACTIYVRTSFLNTYMYNCLHGFPSLMTPLVSIIQDFYNVVKSMEPGRYIHDNQTVYKDL